MECMPCVKKTPSTRKGVVVEQIFGFAVEMQARCRSRMLYPGLHTVLNRVKSAVQPHKESENRPANATVTSQRTCIDDSRQDHHLPVEMFKGSQYEVAVGEQPASVKTRPPAAITPCTRAPKMWRGDRKRGWRPAVKHIRVECRRWWW